MSSTSHRSHAELPARAAKALIAPALMQRSVPWDANSQSVGASGQSWGHRIDIRLTCHKDPPCTREAVEATNTRRQHLAHLIGSKQRDALQRQWGSAVCVALLKFLDSYCCPPHLKCWPQISRGNIPFNDVTARDIMK